MCTVTIIPVNRTDQPGVHLRLVANRDELRSRRSALPPALQRAGAQDAIWPVDPVGGGTWIGATATGLIATLLNRNAPDDAQGREPGDRSDWSRTRFAGRTSRGVIIPRLLECPTLEAAGEFARGINAADHAPFRLVVFDSRGGFDLTSNGSRLSPIETFDFVRPVMFTSSGLGDHLVNPPRRALFDEWFGPAPQEDWPALQAAFHRHQWPEHGELSVLMTRHDARTVSMTTIDLDEQAVTVCYQAIGDNTIAQPVCRSLPRAEVMLG